MPLTTSGSPTLDSSSWGFPHRLCWSCVEARRFVKRHCSDVHSLPSTLRLGGGGGDGGGWFDYSIIWACEGVLTGGATLVNDALQTTVGIGRGTTCDEWHASNLYRWCSGGWSQRGQRWSYPSSKIYFREDSTAGWTHQQVWTMFFRQTRRWDGNNFTVAHRRHQNALPYIRVAPRWRTSRWQRWLALAGRGSPRSRMLTRWRTPRWWLRQTFVEKGGMGTCNDTPTPK